MKIKIVERVVLYATNVLDLGNMPPSATTSLGSRLGDLGLR